MNDADVPNQSTPYADVNLYAANAPLRDALRFHLPAFDEPRFEALGAECGSAELQRHARLANTCKPVLHTHDRCGRRIDQVEFHPSYHALMARALHHGLHGTPFARGPGSHVERAAAFMLYTEADASVLCPVSMTYAATPALRANPAVYAAWQPGLVGTRYDPRFVPSADKTALTVGMGMTEKQGGSDVRANTTRATFEQQTPWGRAFRIDGHKWFLSAPMSDGFLVLAQAPAGSSCFFVPRLLPDGTVNGLKLQRLKDKLGNQANASSEVEFDAAIGWAVGDEGRGIPQILAMGVLTRLDCALNTAGLMRQALGLAIHHTRERMAFGKHLADQPLMKNVLADLALESEAATALALRLARAIDVTEHGDGGAAAEHEAVLRRVLTPVAKFWVCKRGAAFAQEAMECLGGNGYVEAGGEGVMARVYREMPLSSIWEGAGNIMALDLLRALRTGPVADVLAAELGAARGEHPAFDRLAAALPSRLDGGTDEPQARVLARDIALLVQASLLRRHATDAVFDAFCRTRLDAACDVYGALPAGIDTDAVLERALPH